MEKEIQDHTDRKHWKLRLWITLEPGTKIIKAIWSFKHKRHPDGTLIKHKACLCAHGGMQTYRENYWDTYFPVVSWMTIRTMLTVLVIKNLHTPSIDFTLAFPQADVEVPIFMEVPFGFKVDSTEKYVLELRKNLYGLKQAGKTWFDFLSEGLEQLGFTCSNVDMSVFYKEGMIIIIYVDDCLIFCEKESQATALIKRPSENIHSHP